MKKSLIALAAFALVAAAFDPKHARTRDVAFTYRMGAGFAGDVNRTHPASIVPGLQDSTTPVRKYGDGALIDTTHNAYRGIVAGDASDATAINLAGVLVRDFPTQAATAAGNNGQQLLTDPTTAPSAGVVSFIRQGFVMVKVRGTGAVTLDGRVFVFASADEAGHVLGGFEVALVAGKTVPIANARFRGPADANGIAEMEIWAAGPAGAAA